jgi:hypothetical protein
VSVIKFFAYLFSAQGPLLRTSPHMTPVILVVVVVVFITPGRTDLIRPMAMLNCSRIPAFHLIYIKESPTAVPNISALAPLA